MANFFQLLRHAVLIPLLLLLLIIISVINTTSSQTIIDTLPGFYGNLPFKLETGYVGVGNLDEVQLFYYFFQSERSPKDDPLLLWLTGGPGCSGLSAIFYENGPIHFNYVNSSGAKPILELNPYSWTKIANIIYLDAPVGAGFSYSQSAEGYNSSDTSQAAQNYEFLRKWLLAHPWFLNNPLYVTGDSYSGMIVPTLVEKIDIGNNAGADPPMNLKGFVIGNPMTQPLSDLNSRVEFAFRIGLIPHQLYESAKIDCKGQYIHPDPADGKCFVDLDLIERCILQLDTAQILEPRCSSLSPKPPSLFKWDPSFRQEKLEVISMPTLPGPWCRNYNYLYSYIWANDKNVRHALRVQEGTKREWDRCNGSLSYTYDIPSVVNYHLDLTKKPYRGLIYSGDHDMVVPYVGTIEWIEGLNLTIDDPWRPWFTDGQIAGYTVLYSKNKYGLTYATVKGAGHTAPEFKPKECLAMVARWFAYTPI